MCTRLKWASPDVESGVASFAKAIAKLQRLTRRVVQAYQVVGICWHPAHRWPGVRRSAELLPGSREFGANLLIYAQWMTMARCANVAIGLPVRGDVLLLPMFGSRLAQALATARRGGHFDRLFFLVMMFDNFERF